MPPNIIQHLASVLSEFERVPYTPYATGPPIEIAHILDQDLIRQLIETDDNLGLKTFLQFIESIGVQLATQQIDALKTTMILLEDPADPRFDHKVIGQIQNDIRDQLVRGWNLLDT